MEQQTGQGLALQMRKSAPNLSTDQGYSFLDSVNVLRLSEEDQKILEKFLGVDEIRKLINSLKLNKTLDCDDLTGEVSRSASSSSSEAILRMFEVK